MTEAFIHSVEFKQYHRKVIETCNKYLTSRLFGKEQDLTEIRGAMELARKLIYLPLTIRQDDCTKQLVQESLKCFEVAFILHGLRLGPEEKTN
jgi:hypothetical protein